MHSSLTDHLQVCIVVGDVPTWMTKGKTTLIQKDPEKRNAANNYHSNTLLPLMWKLLTSVLMKKVYTYITEKNELTDEQKGCRKDSQRKKDQFVIGNQILKHCKKYQRNLAVRFFDY